MTAQGTTVSPNENSGLQELLKRANEKAQTERRVAIGGAVAACVVMAALLAAGFLHTLAIDLRYEADFGDSFQIWSSAASIAGTAIASATIALALISYWNAQRGARLAHMHALFRELMKFEYERRRESGKRTHSNGSSLSTTGLLLYSLEEIADAVNQEARFALFPRRKRFIADWRRTIRSHIALIDRGELFRHLDEHADCYGEEFLLQIAEWSNSNDVRLMVVDELSQRPRKNPNQARRPYKSSAQTPTVAGATASEPIAQAGIE